jgi:DNA ligase-1
MKPMLSASLEEHHSLEQLTWPKLASPKIDGWRVLLNPDGPLTRKLKRFKNIHFNEQMTGVTAIPLDGEVVVGKPWQAGVLQATGSGIGSYDGEPDFRVYIFDAPGVPSMRFQSRLEHAQAIVSNIPDERVRFLRHVTLRDLQDMLEYEAKQLAKGYEGIMLRDPDGRYKYGRSTFREQGLIKIKRFVDFEAVVTGYYEEEENRNEAKRDATGRLKRSSHKAGKFGKGRLGGFVGRSLVDDVPIRVGSGFTDEQRIHYWAIRDKIVRQGWVMKCSKQLVGEKDKPRHPTFLAFRHEEDL